MLLRDQLSAARASVITTSSRAGTARDAQVDLDDLDMAVGYDGLRAYKSSKLANVLFSRELARRWGHLGVSTAAVHPPQARSPMTPASPNDYGIGRQPYVASRKPCYCETVKNIPAHMQKDRSYLDQKQPALAIPEFEAVVAIDR